METKDERDKLMFRIRVKIDPERLRAHADSVRSGLPGVAYVRYDRRSPGRPSCKGTSPQVNGRERPVARIAGVTQAYGRVVALDDISIEIPADCIVGFIGPDGVGKSTLLNLIAGSRRMQSGHHFRPRRRHGKRGASGGYLSAHRLYAARLGQESLPDLSVRENIEFFGRLFGQSRSERDAKISEFLDGTGLAPFPTARRRNCPAACGRSSGSVAVSFMIRIS